MATTDPSSLHVSVLAATAVPLLAVRPGCRVLDATLGLGGHSESLLRAGCVVTGVDRDPAARELAQQRLAWAGDALTVVAGTFAEAAEGFVAAGTTFDGILADLGVSSLQLDDPARGFSFRSDAEADMRMGDGCADTAAALIAHTPENDLADLIFRYGEERRSRPVARALKRAVGEGRTSAAALAEAIRAAVPGHQPRHPAIRTFQALRIAVNGELDELERLLAAIPRLLAPGGKAVVISFHSLEDRLVKQSFKAQVAGGLLGACSRSVTEADRDEVAANPRAASAKLRWAEAKPLPVATAAEPTGSKTWTSRRSAKQARIDRPSIPTFQHSTFPTESK